MGATWGEPKMAANRNGRLHRSAGVRADHLDGSAATGAPQLPWVRADIGASAQDTAFVDGGRDRQPVVASVSITG